MKRLALASIIALGLLLMLPNAALLFGTQQATGYVWIIVLLVVPLGLLLGYFVLLGRKLSLACLLLAPFALLTPVVTFYVYHYGAPITEALLGTIVTTNPEETYEYFGSWLWPLIILTITSGALAVVAARLCSLAHLQVRKVRRVHTTLFSLATVVLLSFIGTQILAGHQSSSRARTHHTSLAVRVEHGFQYGYPFGVLVTLGGWWQDHVHMEAAIAKIKDFRFHVHRQASVQKRQIYVLVIGESSRRNHWQLFGYDRPTNPKLTKLSNLIPITRMVAAWPLTIGAVPDMLTRKPPTMPIAKTFPEASIVRVMREAGFDTWWLSNQNPAGKANSAITVYADESAHVRWLSLHKYDSDLRRALSTVLNKTHGDLFVVLHMMGSHRNYDERYPAQFKRFTPTIADGNRFNPDVEQTINSYDNTILYTDHVLATLIGLHKETNAVTALWYESDHGETLPTATCPTKGHGYGYRYEFPIPAFFWYSDAYAGLFPEKINTLRANRNKRVTDNDTFATLVDMVDVDFPGHDESRSLFISTWHYRPRTVNPDWQKRGKWVDYDEAVLGDGCEPIRAKE